MSGRREPDNDFVWLPHLPHAVVEAHREEIREGRERSPVAQLERTRQRLDQIDLEIAGLRRIQVADTRERLRRDGLDASGYELPPFPHRLERRSGRDTPSPEQHTTTWPTRPDEQRTLRHYVGGYVTGIR
jgi:hypothetical protein